MRLYDFYGSPEGPVNIVCSGSHPYLEFTYMAVNICEKYFINPSTRSLDAQKECWTVRIDGKDALPLVRVIIPESTIRIRQQEDGASPQNLCVRVETGKLVSTITIERKKLTILKTENYIKYQK